MNSHVIPTPAYRQASLRTGAEYMAPDQVPENYCKVSEQEGKVTKLTEYLMEVTYKDGSVETYAIGKSRGELEGVAYTHELITEFKAGDKIKPGEVLYYHKDFFERDILDPTNMMIKYSKNITIAINTSQGTYEDSSVISSRLASDFHTYNDKPIRKTIDFDTNIDKLVNVGDVVDSNTVLYINSGEGENTSNLDEEALSMLESINALSPVAEAAGVVSYIEVKYNGELDDMSPSLRKLATRMDKELYERTKGTEYEAKTNQVTGEYMSSGGKLDRNKLELSVYIKVKLDAGVGDKLVFVNHCKSVEGDVFDYSIVGARSLDNIDAKFAFVGIQHRVVASFMRQGTVNRVARFRGKQIASKFLAAIKK